MSHRLQALVGESTTEVPLNLTVKVYHRISTYYSSLDKVIVEMQSRFAGNDQEILCALGHVILHLDASDEHYQVVSSHYGVDLDILKAEKNLHKVRHGPYTSIRSTCNCIWYCGKSLQKRPPWRAASF